MWLTRRSAYLGSFLIEDDIEVTAQKNYEYILENILYYQRLFEYNGDVFNLLNLPYNLFQDLIIKQIELKKKEIEEAKNPQGKNHRRISKNNKFIKPTPKNPFIKE